MKAPTREQSSAALWDTARRMETEPLSEAVVPGGTLSEFRDLPVMRREEPANSLTQFSSGLPPKT